METIESGENEVEKYAVVTGADRGLGFDLTLKLLHLGYTVFAGKYMPEWKGNAEIPDDLWERLIPVELDVSSEESVRSACESIRDRTNRVDLLVNNAGIGGDYEGNIFGSIDYPLLQRLYEVNAIGPLRMANALNRELSNGTDKLVVNISSEAGQINQKWRESWYGYCMSKAALNIQSNIMHNQLRTIGGKALVIHPGWLKSYMGGQLSEEGDITTEESAAGIVEQIVRYVEDATEREHPAFLDYAGNEMSWA
ncbi:SDR family NAD(P)-dependent oxidoreductase [Cohnella endophytica]|uniref:SDR family NAD(P)-dependent oxidoreductase n=1 Tax=Cohnella endophytica TaxID=2419778 RepID=A0A494Y5X8_9BACL|nr:SDR family NAD(P)-dependent oxidoreductase [Cohnella endophytica]RKP58080.1 SDR family NAD(P)-dependent oxidoreductase [Cohnella endophytica]